MATRRDVFTEVIKDELGHYPGVELDLKPRGKHRAAIFRFNGIERFVIIPTTSGDLARAPKNTIRDVRATLRDLGAKRLAAVPTSKRERVASASKDVRIGVNRRKVIVSVSGSSPLMDRLKGHSWRIEMRANPDPQGAPFVALVKDVLPAGKQRHRGLVRPVENKATNRWLLNFQDLPSRERVMSLVGEFRAMGVRYLEDTGGALVFELPKERNVPILRGKVLQEAQEAALEEATRPEAPEAPVEPVAPSPAPVLDPQRPIVLQLPKAGVSIEQAIKVLNAAKSRMGSDLRFTIVEGGFIQVVAKYGTA